MKDKIWELIDKGNELPYGFARADLHREAVRLADVSQDKELQFRARSVFLTSADFAGKKEELIVEFTWLLNHLDEYPESYEYSLLWEYKWVIGNLIDFPEFSEEQIHYFLNDARERYLKYSGITTRAIDLLEADFHMQKGDTDKAIELIESCIATPRDYMSDCIACEMSAMSKDWFRLGNVDRAIEIHEDVIDTHKTCAEEPTRTLCRAALYYAKAGQWEKALEAHQAAYPKLTTDNLSVGRSHYAMCYKILAGRLSDAVSIFDRHLAPIRRTRALAMAFDFYQASEFLFQSLREKGKEFVKLRSGNQLPLTGENNEYRLDDLTGWAHREAKTIGEKFDQRNRTHRFAERLESGEPFGARL